MRKHASRRLRWTFLIGALLLNGGDAWAKIFEQTASAPAPPPSTGDAAVTPDGSYVYTSTSDGIGVYAWNGTTEKLEFLHLHPTNVDGDLVVSPDGAFVYSDSLVGVSTGRVDVLSRDAGTGGLTLVETVTALPGGGGGIIREIAFSADGAQLYVMQSSNVSVFARDPVLGTLTHLQTLTDGVGGIVGLDVPQAAASSLDGAHVYFPGSSAGSIVTFTRDAGTGLLSYASTLYPPSLSSPTGAALSADGLYLYVADFGVSVFSRNPATGALTFVELEPATNGFDLVLSPAEDFVYLTIPVEGGMVTFSRDAVTGELTHVEDLPFGRAWEVTMTADGSYLFTDASALIALKRDPGLGTLSVQQIMAGIPWVRDTVVSPDQSFVYTLGRSAVLVYERDPGTEALTLLGGVQSGLEGADIFDAVALVLTSGGEHLYVHGRDRVSVYERDAGTGGLTALESHIDDTAGVDGLDDADTSVLSPDEAYLYLAGETDDAIAVFQRDAGTGRLTFLDAEELSPLGHATPISPAVSPDGHHLYVAARESDALLVYDRDDVTGLLTHVASYVNGQGGQAHLDGVWAVAVSPDGQFVYAASSALLTFTRNPVTGLLTLLEVLEGVHVAGLGPLRFNSDASLLFAGGASVYRRHADGRLSWISDLPDAPGQKVLVRPDGAFYSQGARFPTFLSGDPALYRVGFECAASPLVSCFQAQKSTLLVRDFALDLKDSLKWIWAKGETTTMGDISLNDGNHYVLCLYDESGPSPVLLHEAFAPADQDCKTKTEGSPKPCWAGNTKVAKYKDKQLSPDGIDSVKLVPKAAPKSQMKITAKGFSVAPPAPPLSLPLRAQLQTATGPCWESEFSSAKKNDPGNFKAVAP